MKNSLFKLRIHVLYLTLTIVSLCSPSIDQFHVTVPHQPCAQFSEAIANSSLPTKIDVTCPSTDASIMEIQFQHLRRFGYEVAFDVDMVWFESCNCKSKEHDGTFHFFLVASGIEAAQHIVMEVKRKIETCTRTHLIQEQSDGIQLSFISRGHYGCTPYPPSSRMMIVQTGLTSLQSSWGRMPGLTSLQSSWGGRMPGLGGPERKMSAIPPGSASWTFSPGALATNHLRRNTVQPLLSARSPSPLPPSPRHSPSPSPVPSPSHSPSSSTHSKTTLHEFRRGSHPSTSSKSDTSDSGVPLDEFDSSRSAPPLYPARKATLGDLHKGNRSFDYSGNRKNSVPVPSRVTLNDLTDARREGHDSGTLFPSKDSALGGSADLILEASGHRSAYDHLESHKGYDHLPPPGQQPNVPPRSLASLRNAYIKM